MTRVCLVGADDVDLRAELLASETARRALSSYQLAEPWANCVAVETISIGAAVSLCNDLNWYLRRYTAETLVLEPSVSTNEWLSRALATAVRNERIEPEETGTFLKIYGVVPSTDDASGSAATMAEATTGGDVTAARGPNPAIDDDELDATDDGGEDGPSAGDGSVTRLAEPLFARRVGGETPAYDLREVVDTVVVRVTAGEFGA